MLFIDRISRILPRSLMPNREVTPPSLLLRILSHRIAFLSRFDSYYSTDPGYAISNSDIIRTAHNSFARPEVFVSDDEKYSKKGKDKNIALPQCFPISLTLIFFCLQYIGGRSEDAYHFIAYLPFNGCVYELDGLKPGSIKIGVVQVDSTLHCVIIKRDALN